MSIMDLKGIVNKPKRNGFDLSENVSFTAKVGEILPVMVKEIIPGDKMKIDIRNFTRTVPVNTAAYTRIKEYYDVYFVPNRLLWNRFDAFITQMRNSQHASGINTPDNNVIKEHPYITVRDIINHYTNSKDDVNELGFNRALLSAKLLEYLGYSDMTRIVNLAIQAGGAGYLENINVKLNPFPILAYQKIYQDYFRNDQWEVPRPDFYNLDYITSTSSPQLQIYQINNKDSLFDLRYCNYKKDLFMGLLPNAQFSETDSYAFVSSTNTIHSYRFTANNQIANADADAGQLRMFNGMLQASGEITKNIDGIQLYTDNIGKLSVLALRQAEALQKWNEISQATKYDYKHQIESHWGVNVPNVRSGLCSYLGGYSSVIDIDGIDNTNITARENGTDVNKANIAGKGVGAGRGFIEFDSKDYGNEHGILMCVYHAIPELDYYPYGITPLNLKTEPTDYAIPELDATGMQEVPMINLIFDETDNNTSVVGKYLGFAPRYYDYKTAIDTIKGAFLTSYQDWVAPLSREYLKANVLDVERLTYAFFKVNPQITFPIFGIEPDSHVETDTMLVNAMIDCKAVRNLDYNGLPY